MEVTSSSVARRESRGGNSPSARGTYTRILLVRHSIARIHFGFILLQAIREIKKMRVEEAARQASHQLLFPHLLQGVPDTCI